MGAAALFVRGARAPGEPAGHRLRAGWRVAIFLALVLALGAAATVIATRVFHFHPPAGITAGTLAFGEFFQLGMVLLVVLVMGRIEGRWPGDYGLPLDGAGETRRPFGRMFWTGSLWGLLAVAALIGMIAALGGLTIGGLAIHGAEIPRQAALWALGFIGVGLFEEFYYRGYLLFTLSSGIGFWPSAILLSADFGAEHFFNKPMETLVDAVSVALIGLFPALTLRRTGSLWFAIGFHFAFDWAALFVFAAPNSGNHGLPLAGHLLDVRYTGPAWLTGGPLGIEASGLVFVVIAALFLIFNARYRGAKWPASRTRPAAAVSLAA